MWATKMTCTSNNTGQRKEHKITVQQYNVLAQVEELHKKGVAIVTAGLITLPTTSETIRTVLHVLHKVGYLDKPLRGGYVLTQKGGEKLESIKDQISRN